MAIRSTLPIPASAVLLAFTVAISTMASGVARADRASAALVAPVVVRVLSYERTLAARAGDAVDLVVFHSGSGASASEAQALEQALRSMGSLTAQGLPVRVRTAPYSAARLTQELGEGLDVIVLATGLESDAAAIGASVRRRQILTIGTTLAHAQNGSLLAVYVDAGRPRIAVNMAQVRAAGTQLSAQLLRLCLVL